MNACQKMEIARIRKHRCDTSLIASMPKSEKIINKENYFGEIGHNCPIISIIIGTQLLLSIKRSNSLLKPQCLVVLVLLEKLELP